MIEIDEKHYSVIVDGKSVPLYPIEWDIFKILWDHRGSIVKYAQLTHDVYGGRGECGDRSKLCIRVHIKNIRKKLGDPAKESRYIITWYDWGYEMREA